MPFFRNGLCQAWVTFSLLVACTQAQQQCYYPDGTPSTDTPCGNSPSGSSCCSPNAFCLDDGLCFRAGIVSRGSCTDANWGSEACASYCRKENSSGTIAIMPCSTMDGSSTFVCGLDSDRCSNEANTFALANSGSVVLRPSQVSAIVEPILRSAAAAAARASTTASSFPIPDASTLGYFTSGQMAGLGAGLAIPLVISLICTLYLWQKERARHPKLMYQLPDGEEFKDWKLPPPAFDSRLAPPSRTGSSIASFGAVSPAFGRDASPHMYGRGSMEKSGARAEVQEFTAELDGQPVGSAFRFETGQRVKSTKVTVRSAGSSPNLSQRQF